MPKIMQKTSGQLDSLGDHLGTLHLLKTIEKQMVFPQFQKQLSQVWGAFLGNFGLHCGLLWGTFGIQKSIQNAI